MVHELYARTVRLPSPKRRSFVALAFFLGVVSVSGRVVAAAPVLDAAGRVACPSAEEFRRAIVAQLKSDPFDAVDAPNVVLRIRSVETTALVADLAVTPTGTTSATTARHIEGRANECTEIVRAAALSAALAIESEAAPTANALVAPPPEQPSRPPPPKLEEPLPSEAPRASTAADLADDRVVLVASGMTAVGLLPSTSAGVGANVRARVAGRTWISARGTFLPEARMSNDAFGMTLGAGALGACVEPTSSHDVAAALCAHASLGSLAVSSASVPMQYGGAKLFAAGTLSLGARARLVGPVTVNGDLAAYVPFAHPTFLTATCPASGFQQPFLALALGFGIGVSIP